MRLEKLDILRTIAILLMVFFHLNYSLVNIFGINTLNFSKYFWNTLGGFSANLFIFIAGISFFLAEKKYNNKIYKKYLKYSLFLGIIALIISLSTYLLFPEKYIKFGIIHFFSIAFLLIILFKKLRYFNLPIAIFCIIYGLYFIPVIESKYFFSLGFVYYGFWSIDYYPIFPYFGVILLGYVFGLFLEKINRLYIFKLNKDNIFTKSMVYIGKRSLFIYLIHQPIIIGIIWIMIHLSKA